ncbi:MAG: hypothetical protein AB7U43_10870 [Desulfobacter sp.]
MKNTILMTLLLLAGCHAQRTVQMHDTHPAGDVPTARRNWKDQNCVAQAGNNRYYDRNSDGIIDREVNYSIANPPNGSPTIKEDNDYDGYYDTMYVEDMLDGGSKINQAVPPRSWFKKKKTHANHGLESTSAPPAAGTLETHP